LAVQTTVLIGGLMLSVALSFHDRFMRYTSAEPLSPGTPAWTTRPTRALARERADTNAVTAPATTPLLDRSANLSKDSTPSAKDRLPELLDPQAIQLLRRFSGETTSSGMDARSIDVHPPSTPHMLSPRTRSLPTMSADGNFDFSPVRPALAALKEGQSNHASRR
jgi:hypothetical protein